jgi:hypothetical protein
VPSIVYNTIDNPIFPTSGKRLSASIDWRALAATSTSSAASRRWPSAHAADVVQRARGSRWSEYGSTKSLPISSGCSSVASQHPQVRPAVGRPA